MSGSPHSIWAGGGEYHSWAGFLESWARSGAAADPSRLPRLERERFPGDTWERLARRMAEALEERLQRWADGLTGAMTHAADEFSVGRALAQARSELAAIRDLAGHEGLDTGVREALSRAVDKQIGRLQKDMEQDLSRLRREGTIDERRYNARLRTLRDNPLTAVISAGPASGPGPAPARRAWDPGPGTVPGRRLFTD
jgi:hypothetical protein